MNTLTDILCPDQRGDIGKVCKQMEKLCKAKPTARVIRKKKQPAKRPSRKKKKDKDCGVNFNLNVEAGGSLTMGDISNASCCEGEAAGVSAKEVMPPKVEQLLLRAAAEPRPLPAAPPPPAAPAVPAVSIAPPAPPVVPVVIRTPPPEAAPSVPTVITEIPPAPTPTPPTPPTRVEIITTREEPELREPVRLLPGERVGGVIAGAPVVEVERRPNVAARFVGGVATTAQEAGRLAGTLPSVQTAATLTAGAAGAYFGFGVPGVIGGLAAGYYGGVRGATATSMAAYAGGGWLGYGMKLGAQGAGYIASKFGRLALDGLGERWRRRWARDTTKEADRVSKEAQRVTQIAAADIDVVTRIQPNLKDEVERLQQQGRILQDHYDRISAETQQLNTNQVLAQNQSSRDPTEVNQRVLEESIRANQRKEEQRDDLRRQLLSINADTARVAGSLAQFTSQIDTTINQRIASQMDAYNRDQGQVRLMADELRQLIQRGNQEREGQLVDVLDQLRRDLTAATREDERSSLGRRITNVEQSHDLIRARLQLDQLQDRSRAPELETLHAEQERDQEQVTQLQDQIRLGQAEIDRLRRELESEREKAEQIVEVTSASIQEKAVLQAENAKKQGNIERIQATLTQEQQQLERTQNTLRSQTDRINRLEANEAELKSQIEPLNRQISDLTAKVQEKEAEANDLLVQIGAVNSNKEEIQSAIDQGQQFKQELADKEAELRQESSEQRNQIAVLQRRLDEETARHNDIERQIRENAQKEADGKDGVHQRTLREQEEAMIAKNVELNGLKDQIAQLQLQVRQNQDALASLKETKAENAGLISTLQDEVERVGLRSEEEKRALLVQLEAQLVEAASPSPGPTTLVSIQQLQLQLQDKIRELKDNTNDLDQALLIMAEQLRTEHPDNLAQETTQAFLERSYSQVQQSLRKQGKSELANRIEENARIHNDAWLKLIEEKDSTISVQHKKLENLQQANADLTSALDAARGEVPEETAGHLERLRQENARLQGQVERLTAELVEIHRLGSTRLDPANLPSLEEEFVQTAQRDQQFRDKYGEIDEQIQNTINSIKERIKKYPDIEAQVSALQQSLDQKTARVTELTDELQRQQQTTKDTFDANRRLLDRLNDRRRELNNAAEEIADLNGQLATRKHELTDAKEARVSAEQQLTPLKEAVDRAEVEVRSHESVLQSQVKDVEKVKEENKEIKKQLNESYDAHNRTVDRASKLQAELREEKTVTARQTDELAAINADLSAQVSRNEDLTSQLAQSSKVVARLEDKLEATQKLQVSLQADYERDSATLEKQTEQVQSLVDEQGRLSARIDILEKEVAEKQSNIDEQTRTIDEQQGQLQTQQNRIYALQQQAEVIRGEITTQAQLKQDTIAQVYQSIRSRIQAGNTSIQDWQDLPEVATLLQRITELENKLQAAQEVQIIEMASMDVATGPSAFDPVLEANEAELIQLRQQNASLQEALAQSRGGLILPDAEEQRSLQVVEQELARLEDLAAQQIYSQDTDQLLALVRLQESLAARIDETTIQQQALTEFSIYYIQTQHPNEPDWGGPAMFTNPLEALLALGEDERKEIRKAWEQLPTLDKDTRLQKWRQVANTTGAIFGLGQDLFPSQSVRLAKLELERIQIQPQEEADDPIASVLDKLAVDVIPIYKNHQALLVQTNEWPYVKNAMWELARNPALGALFLYLLTRYQDTLYANNALSAITVNHLLAVDGLVALGALQRKLENNVVGAQLGTPTPLEYIAIVSPILEVLGFDQIAPYLLVNSYQTIRDKIIAGRLPEGVSLFEGLLNGKTLQANWQNNRALVQRIDPELRSLPTIAPLLIPPISSALRPALLPPESPEIEEEKEDLIVPDLRRSTRTGRGQRQPTLQQDPLPTQRRQQRAQQRSRRRTETIDWRRGEEIYQPRSFQQVDTITDELARRTTPYGRDEKERLRRTLTGRGLSHLVQGVETPNITSNNNNRLAAERADLQRGLNRSGPPDVHQLRQEAFPTTFTPAQEQQLQAYYARQPGPKPVVTGQQFIQAQEPRPAEQYTPGIVSTTRSGQTAVSLASSFPPGPGVLPAAAAVERAEQFPITGPGALQLVQRRADVTPTEVQPTAPGPLTAQIQPPSLPPTAMQLEEVTSPTGTIGQTALRTGR